MQKTILLSALLASLVFSSMALAADDFGGFREAFDDAVGGAGGVFAEKIEKNPFKDAACDGDADCVGTYEDGVWSCVVAGSCEKQFGGKGKCVDTTPTCVRNGPSGPYVQEPGLAPSRPASKGLSTTVLVGFILVIALLLAGYSVMFAPAKSE